MQSSAAPSTSKSSVSVASSTVPVGRVGSKETIKANPVAGLILSVEAIAPPHQPLQDITLQLRGQVSYPPAALFPFRSGLMVPQFPRFRDALLYVVPEETLWPRSRSHHSLWVALRSLDIGCSPQGLSPITPGVMKIQLLPAIESLHVAKNRPFSPINLPMADI